MAGFFYDISVNLCDQRVLMIELMFFKLRYGESILIHFSTGFEVV